MKEILPIGIFDSGIGGLTVASALKSLLPYELIYYVGDTQNFSYGGKTVEEIQDYSKYIVDFLLKKQCKLIVIACHTASAASYEMLKKWGGDQVPILNVIDPVIEYIKKKYVDQTVGLIGTNYTIQSGIYLQKLQSIGIRVHALATPHLAPIIEQHFLPSSQPLIHLESVLHDYLIHPHLIDVNSLILGSTHYSIVKDSVLNFYTQRNRDLEIIDPSTISALSIQAFLIEKQLVNNDKTSKANVFMSTQFSYSFQQATQFLCGEKAIMFNNNN